MPPAAKKRKTDTAAKGKGKGKQTEPAPEARDEAQPENEAATTNDEHAEEQADATAAAPETTTSHDGADKAKERMERFKALRARAKNSAQSNMKEAALETQRLATDPNLISNLSRKHAIASHKLLKADTEAAGEDFERKRAWDWTIDESEKWDKRSKKKEAHRDDQAFQDYRQHARKVYKRQVKNMAADLDAYEQKKMEAIEKAAASGGLEIVETDDGELVAVDKNGTFYSSADSTSFVENKPDKAAVDRLVNDLQKAEEVRLKNRRARGQDGDDGDVTYINEKNKHFNQKLARFYNKYTTDIRDSFERGTMI